MGCVIGKQRLCCTRIENLSVRAGNEFILKDVNLHIHCGELTAIVGRNGAGKTTFMKALLDTVPHSGRIVFEGERHSEKIDSQRFSRKRFTTKPVFGYVPQSISVESGTPFCVADLVLASVSKKPVWMRRTKNDAEKAEKILSATGASHLLERKLCDLSGGELQRVMLSLAMNPLPDILLLDEPVSGVDRVGLKSFYELVSSIRRKCDITILLISHDLDLVARHADRVVFINNATAAVGSVKEIFSRGDFVEIFGRIDFSQNESGGAE